MRPTRAWIDEQTKGFYIAAYLLLALLIIGTIGYEVIEGWGLLSSFYMTVITISTVGYGEVTPLSVNGKVFTSVLILTGMCIAAYAFATIGRIAIEGELFRLRRLAKMEGAIEKMEEHIIVCGFGRLSRFIIQELQELGKKIVIIEREPEIIKMIEEAGIPYIDGSAHEDATLIRAGVKRAKSLLAVVSSEAENVFITLSARSLNSKLHIVARTEIAGNEVKLIRAGANNVISPYRVSSTRIVQNLLHQHINDFLEIATGQDDKKIALEQIIIPPESPLTGKTLEEANIRKDFGVNVAAIIEPDGETVLRPEPTSTLQDGARLIVFGEKESFESLNEFLEA